MRRRKTSRRAFLKLLAAGSAAAIAAPASSLAAVTKPAARTTRPGAARTAPPAASRLERARAGEGGHVALPAEIEKQKKSTLASLKALRDYPLPAGSPQAFAFRPLKVRRGRRSS